MKKIHQISALCCAVIAAGAAAQDRAAPSSVTLFGILDACVVSHKSATGASLQVNGGGCFYGSRIGFRGNEDLGGGLRAYFHLEGGFNADSGQFGQGGRIFGRKSLVGLSGSWGALEAGREYAPAFYILSATDPMQLGIGSATATVWSGSPGTAVGRTDNSINYMTPSFGGVTARVQIAPGEQNAPAASRGGDTTGLNLMYRDKQLVVGLAHAKVRNAAANADDKATTVSAKYDFGAFSVAGIVQSGAWAGTRATAASSATAMFSRDYRSYVVGGSVNAGVGSVSMSYKKYDDRTASNFDATILSAIYIHPLSKRTRLYAGVTRLKNIRGSSYGAADGNGTYAGTAPGGSSRSIDLGITHFF
jgi:GBP family porin